MDSQYRLELISNLAHGLKAKRARVFGTAALIASTLAFLSYRYGSHSNPNFDPFRKPVASIVSSPSPGEMNWSQYAYSQYITNTEYLCNSVMLFETLHRLGSKADRLMMYPATMQPDPASVEGRLLLKAQNEYNVKLKSIEVQHRPGFEPTWADSYTKLLAFNQTEYSRVLSLDSDSVVLQHMDELFHLPSSPVAMPRAYWLENQLSSQLLLIQPSAEEFARIETAIKQAKNGEFDMEIVNNLYGKNCLVLPHRPYDLLTGEFRAKGRHENYLGNGYEVWDPEKIYREAKLLHFSDWPMPKPWIHAQEDIKNKTAPTCDKIDDERDDCRARDMWLGFYSDFRESRENVCGMEGSKLESRSNDAPPRSAHEYIPELV
ncbi:Glucose N-acetyltransferase [Lachnellula willkommii]|uniref:Glucose N-acetyltransferase n=1 Tax=Lachnellula willkommii TaxID=215461 RepID=A0A559MJK4_9HELO|nr:Glucose N-acetyltransferase [Lachnellula willkommii]